MDLVDHSVGEMNRIESFCVNAIVSEQRGERVVWIKSSEPFLFFQIFVQRMRIFSIYSILEKSLKVILNFASQKDAISSVVSGAWFPN